MTSRNHTPLVALAMVISAALCTRRAVAQSPPTAESHQRYRIEAILTEDPPRIDGSLDDAVWSSAVLIDDFVQQEPNEGAPASERTEVRILYDAANLYVGVRAFDSEPGAITATEMRRDSDRILDEDNVQLILDTFMDSRSAYMFVTNPLGAQLDQQVFEEGEGSRFGFGTSNINRDWDGIWSVEARRTDEGWIVEMAIPMVTLRFPDSDPQSWGLNVMRNIGRKNEQAFWAPIPRAYGLTRVSLAGTLAELRNLRQGSDLRITPSFVGGARRVVSEGATDDSFRRDLGLDLRYGVTAGLNLDLTVNTDFAQAEVDDERVNLTRFPLFYPEKRDFFLENAGQFAVGSSASITRYVDLFFSRRIGLAANGEAVPILGGTRLTGRVGRNSIAVMDVQTDAAFGVPAENFLVARYSRAVFERSRVGGIVINKEQIESDYHNRTFAADMVLAPHPAFTVTGFVAKTQTPGLDGGDMGGYLNATWLDTRWRVYGEYVDIGADFNPEVGFLPRAGIRTTKLHLERNPRPGVFGIRMLSPMVNVVYTTDRENRLVSRRIHSMVGTRFDNGAYLNVWYNRDYERLDEPFVLNGVTIPVGGYSFGEWRFSFDSNPAKRVYYGVSWMPATFFGGTRNDVNLGLGVRVSSRLSADVGYQRNDVELPGGQFEVDVAALKVDFAFSPTVTLRTLTQYNSSSNQWGASARFRWTYSPGSDLYVVYDEVRRDPTGLSLYRDRRLILKGTYLLSG